MSDQVKEAIIRAYNTGRNYGIEQVLLFREVSRGPTGDEIEFFEFVEVEMVDQSRMLGYRLITLVNTGAKIQGEDVLKAYDNGGNDILSLTLEREIIAGWNSQG
jgi:hypothetical protein